MPQPSRMTIPEFEEKLRGFLGDIKNIRKAMFAVPEAEGTGKSFYAGLWNRNETGKGVPLVCWGLNPSKKDPAKITAKGIYTGDQVYALYGPAAGELIQAIMLGAAPASEEEWKVSSNAVERKDKPPKKTKKRRTKQK